MEDELNNDATIYRFPARVQRIQNEERRSALLERLREIVLDESILEEHPPFFGRAEISNGSIDSYFSYMDETSLRNYAADAAKGVAFQNSHKRMELPMGRSLTGSYVDGEPARVVADFYMLPGLNLNGVNTDDVIRGIRSGIVSDVSIGFHGGTTRCSICGNEYFSWDCNHLAGLKYETKEGDVVRQTLATYGIFDAHLAEFSAVYDGATPGASILKAERMIQDGRVSPDEIRLLEEQYRVKLPVAKRTFTGVDAPKKRSKDMEGNEELIQIRSVLELKEDGNILSSIEGMVADLEAMRAQVKGLEPLAKDGQQYRSDLVAEALAQGVRAHGEDFDQETYKTMLENAPLATVKRMKEDWQKVGDKRFTGGRKTADDAAPSNPDKAKAPAAEPQRKRVQMPTGAYKV